MNSLCSLYTARGEASSKDPLVAKRHDVTNAFPGIEPIRVLHTLSYRDERRPLSNYCDVLQAFNQQRIEFRRHGSGALGLADVACGRNDGYLELHINAWDALAGLLLVEEAGGWTNDFLAGDGLTRGNIVIAATPELRDRLLAIIG